MGWLELCPQKTHAGERGVKSNVSISAFPLNEAAPFQLEAEGVYKLRMFHYSSV